MLNRRRDDKEPTSIRRINNVETKTSLIRRILVETIRISTSIRHINDVLTPSIRRRNKNVVNTSNPRRNDEDFDVEVISTRLRREFDADSTRIRRRCDF